MPEQKRRKRLIDANALERYTVEIGGHRYIPWLAVSEVPGELLEELPEPAGKWVRKFSGRDRRRACSRCGRVVAGQWREYSFCPRCGVRMETGGAK